MKVEIEGSRDAVKETTLFMDRDGSVWITSAHDEESVMMIMGSGIGAAYTFKQACDSHGPLKRFTGTVTLSNED